MPHIVLLDNLEQLWVRCRNQNKWLESIDSKYTQKWELLCFKRRLWKHSWKIESRNVSFSKQHLIPPSILLLSHQKSHPFGLMHSQDTRSEDGSEKTSRGRLAQVSLGARRQNVGKHCMNVAPCEWRHKLRRLATTERRMNMQIWNTKCTYQLIISHDIQNHIHNFHFPSVIYHNHIMYLFSSAPQATLTLVRPSKGCNQQTFSIICPQIPSGASSISSASVDGGWNTWWKMHACSSSK